MSIKPTLRLVALIVGVAIVNYSLVAIPAQANQRGRSRPPAAKPNSAKAKPAGPTIWNDPGAVETLDFVNGSGGADHAPKPPFTFIEEDTGGTNPKVKVTDAAGQEWGVKWGSEVHSEVFASRIVWAAGYWVEPNYFVGAGRIDGVKGLGRAKKYVGSNGNFTNARFELKEKGIQRKTKKESWSWDNNPFVGTPQLTGLRIIMMLTSNWDPKDSTDDTSNTQIQIVKKTGEARYVFGDWGATMGKWGGYFSREKWDCEGYTDQTSKFVTGVTPGALVTFGYDGKHASQMKENVRVSDVEWLLRYVGRITDAQLREGLRASAATPEEVQCFSSAIRQRIDQLRRAVQNARR